MSQESNPTAAQADTTWLANAIERILRPLVRILISSVTFPAFSEIAKRVFIEEADHYLRQREEGKEPTKSALALITGIDTRVINQTVTKEDEKIKYSAKDMCPEAAVLDRWDSDPEFLHSETGKPSDLQIYGQGKTFQTLVTRSVGRNVTPTTVLERLLESENVKIINDHSVRMLSRYYLSLKRDSQAKIESGAHAASNLLRVVDHNLNTPDKKSLFLQQQRWTSMLPVEEREEFRAKMRALLLQHISESSELLERSESSDKEGQRMTSGIGYYYWED